MPIAPHIPRCHFVKTTGIRCGSPSMHGRNLCYYHIRTTTTPPARPTGMPQLEDGAAIQLGLANVIRRTLMCDLEYAAARVLLHAYKLAIFNLRNIPRTDLWPKDVIIADPASDPTNAGDITEPRTYDELESLAANLPDTNLDDPDRAAKKPARRLTPNEELLRLLNLDSSEEVEKKEAGAPPAGPSQVGVPSRETCNVPPCNDQSESEGRHYLAQHVSAGSATDQDSSPVGTAQTPKRQPTHHVDLAELERVFNKKPEDITAEDQAIVEAAISKLAG